MGLIKKKDGEDFQTKRIGVTYVLRLEDEAPLNENIVEDTGNIHKRITLLNGTEKAKRSGNSIKAQHRRSILDFLGLDETQCDPTVKACGRCLACALHGFAMVRNYPTEEEKNAMHSSMVSFSDMISVETADECITGLEETMLKSPSLTKEGSPQPFFYERVRAGTHLVGTAYITFTGRKTMYEIVFKNENQIIDTFWYGLRSILTNQTYQLTPMTARHDTKFTPILLIISEVQELPADIMISPDLTKTDVPGIIDDLNNKIKRVQKILNTNNNPNKIEVIEGGNILDYLTKKGNIRTKDVTIKPKKESGNDE
ncbi:MAG: hypothetical protein ACE5KE_08305 [Methanosarcinales archaeon]